MGWRLPSSSAQRTMEKLRGCWTWSGKALRVQLPLDHTYFMPGSALHMFESTLSVPEPDSVIEFNSSSLRGPGVAAAGSASPACTRLSKPGLRSWRSLLRAGARPAPARPPEPLHGSRAAIGKGGFLQQCNLQ